MNSIEDPVGRIARWAVRLQQYDFEVVHRKGKDHVVPDTLSRSVPVVNIIEEAEEEGVDGRDPWYAKMLDVVERHPVRYPLWRVEGGQLFKRIKPTHPELADRDNHWAKVVRKPERKRLIIAHHDLRSPWGF